MVLTCTDELTKVFKCNTYALHYWQTDIYRGYPWFDSTRISNAKVVLQLMGEGVRVVLLLLFSFALGEGVEVNQALNFKLNQRPWKNRHFPSLFIRLLLLFNYLVSQFNTIFGNNICSCLVVWKKSTFLFCLIHIK